MNKEPYKVGEILHYAGAGHEPLVTIETLDLYAGTAFGEIKPHCVVPIAFLDAIEYLGRS